MTYKQPGHHVTVPAPSGGVTVDDIVVIGSLIGIAENTVAQTLDVSISTSGVHTLPKISTDVIAVGDLLYYVTSTKNLTKTAGTGSKPVVGVAVSVAGNPSATVECLLGVTGAKGAA